MDYLEQVKQDSTLDFEITTYEENLEEGVLELLDTDPSNSISWGYEAFDNKLGYILPGQLILLGGTTGTGKSTFANKISQNISNQGIKVGKFSLEDRIQDKKKQELYYEIGVLRKSKGLKNYPMNLFMINGCKIDEKLVQEAMSRLVIKNKNILEIKKNTEKRINIDKLETLIKELIKQGCKLVVIDHLNEFEMTGDKDRNDLKVEQVMYGIKDIGRRYNIAIILIAHYKKLGNGVKPNDESFKDSIAITQVANKVIHLYRDKMVEDGITEVIISKNRDNPSGTGILELNYDKDIGDYTNIQSSKQQQVDNKAGF